MIFRAFVFAAFLIWPVGSTELWAQASVVGVEGDSGSSFSLRSWTARAGGIPHGTVFDIVSSPDGFLWIATFNGLARFDGHRFRVFDVANSEGLLSNQIISVYFDSRGDLWLGHQSVGLSLFRGSEFQSFHDLLPTGSVWAMTEGPQGDLWISTDKGLVRLHKVDDGIKVEDIFPGSYRTAFFDSRGDLWAGSLRGLMRRETGTTAFALDSRLPTVPVFDLLEDEDGRLWAATQVGLYFLEPDGEEWQLLVEAGCPLQMTASLATLALGPDGEVWFKPCFRALLASDSSLYRVSRGPAGKRSVELIDLEGIPVTTAPVATRAGALWMGTLGQGLSVLLPRLIKRWPVRDSVNQEIRAVVGDLDGKLWLSMDCSAPLTHFHDGEFIEHRFPSGERFTCVGGMTLGQGGDLWFGARGELIRLHQGQVAERRQLVESKPDRHSINAVLEEPDGSLWVGLNGEGLARIEGEQTTFFSQEDGLPNRFVHSLLTDRSGSLWIGTRRGLARFENGVFTVFSEADGCPPGTVRAIIEASDGSLWVGSYGGGLARYGDGRLTLLTTEQGLFDNVVTQILEDSRSNLWMLGNAGLSYVPLTELNAVADGRAERVRSVAFDQVDGMIEGSGGRQPAGWRAPDGRMWFPTIDGLATIDPEGIQIHGQAPSVAVVETVVEGRVQEASEKIELSAGEGDLEIHYTAPSSLPANNMFFAYRLAGYDEDWISAGSRRTAFYTNLSPGDYVFQVKVADRYGVWSPRPASLAISVAAPWWRTRWAYFSYVLVFSLTLLGFVHWQQRRLEKERAISRRLREVDQIKDQILANTSHELRTPLYGMIGLAESLLGGASGALPDGARSQLQTLVVGGRRLTTLVDGILDFSKLKHDAAALDLEPVDVRGVCAAALAVSLPLVGTKDLLLVNQIEPDFPRVLADSAKLQQILINLLGNAVKFSESGRIEVSASRQRDGVVVSVADSGIGIADEDHNRIFEAFEQIDGSADRVYGGIGLGLALTRSLVELHGGRIWVESAVGDGSKFCFSLPMAMEQRGLEPPASGVDKESAPTNVEPPPEFEKAAPGESVGGRPTRILVVDDEPINREVLVSQLKVGGYGTEVAENGAEALAKLEQGGLDLVLLDVMMPHMSGYEVCREIRRTRSPQDLPVIFLTAKNRDDDRVVGLNEGGNDYLAKPVSMGELLARVKTQISLKLAYERLDELLEKRTEQVQQLGELLPICAGCKKIRDDEGYWEQVEVFLSSRSQVQFSHGLCPDCMGQAMDDAGTLDEPS